MFCAGILPRCLAFTSVVSTVECADTGMKICTIDFGCATNPFAVARLASAAVVLTIGLAEELAATADS